MENAKKAWIVRRPQTRAALRLFCFPYAGGGASVYSAWQEDLGPTVEVCAIQAPGRESRAMEPPIREMSRWVAALAPALVEHSRLPFAFFGHSLGAIAAFEMSRYLMHRGLPLPKLLFVSGAAAPSSREGKGQTHLLPDPQFMQQLADMEGTPAEVLANRELMAYLLPMIRADFEMSGTYAYRPSLRLPIPIVAYAGTQDRHAEPDRMQPWAAEGAADFRLHAFEGGHFFLHSQGPALRQCVADELKRSML